MKLSCISVPRSGGTWIKNMMCACGIELHSVHLDFDVNPDFIITRDIRDSIISYSLALNVDVSSAEQMELFVNGPGKYILDCASLAKSHLYANEHLPILRYEDVKLNPFFVFDFLKDSFGYCTKNQTEIVDKFCESEMLKISNRYSDFSNYDKETGIHGRHLNGGDIGRWKILGKPELDVLNKIVSNYVI